MRDQLRPDEMQTYAVLAPRDDEDYRPASCAEAECPDYMNGWATTLDPATELGRSQILYVRRDSRRLFTETALESGLIRFAFSPGQTCFRVGQAGTHRVQVAPSVFLVRGGDSRGNPRGQTRVHKRREDWVEDFATHQNTLADILKREKGE